MFTKPVLIVVAMLVIMLSATASAASVSIGIADEQGLAGSTVSVPVTVSGASGLGGLDFVLAYDPDVLSPVNVSAGSLCKGIIESNTSIPGLISVSMADPDGMNDTGDVAIILFSVIGAPDRMSDLILSNIQAFDAATLGEIPVTAANGTFTVRSAAAGVSPAPSGGEALIMSLIALGLVAGISTFRRRYG